MKSPMKVSYDRPPHPVTTYFRVFTQDYNYDDEGGGGAGDDPPKPTTQQSSSTSSIRASENKILVLKV